MVPIRLRAVLCFNKLKSQLLFAPTTLDQDMTRRNYRTLNRFVGARIRERRILLGLSQRELAEIIGRVTQQMIFKYELGKDAVSASLLYELAGALGTSVEYFFDGFGANEAVQRPAPQTTLLNLMRNLSGIENEEHLGAISHLIRALAKR
jgi:transcriptional regulator with XRE-family HTH domain